MRPGPRRPLPAWLAAAAPVAGLSLLSILLFVRGGEVGRGLPGASVGTAYSLLYGGEAVRYPARPREDVRLVPRPAPASGTARGDEVPIAHASMNMKVGASGKNE